MKKMVSMLLAAALAAVLPVSARALGDVQINQDSAEQSGSIQVDYSMGPAYTVTIPASVTFTDGEKSVDRGLQVSNVLLDEGRSLNVGVTSQNGFQMKNGDGYIGYALTVNYSTTPEDNGFCLLTVHAGEKSGWVVLTFTTDLNKDHAQYAGRYSDILTFTVSVD